MPSFLRMRLLLFGARFSPLTVVTLLLASSCRASASFCSAGAYAWLSTAFLELRGSGPGCQKPATSLIDGPLAFDRRTSRQVESPLSPLRAFKTRRDPTRSVQVHGFTRVSYAFRGLGLAV